MSQIYYSPDDDPGNAKLYIHRGRNTMEFDRDEAERIARSLAEAGGYARVIFGSQTLAEYSYRELIEEDYR